MASLEEHTEYNEKLLGHSDLRAHKYIDRYFAKYGPYHRHKLHHIEGIKQCAKELSEKYGKEIPYWEEQLIRHVELDFHYCGLQYPIPYFKDYIGGHGFWPIPMPWGRVEQYRFAEEQILDIEYPGPITENAYP